MNGLRDDSFSGWGVRTVASGDARFNPMSYHNGSVWPHDNALIAYGLSRYRLADESLRILTGLFDASLFVNLHRMPELFCGFPLRPGEGTPPIDPPKPRSAASAVSSFSGMAIPLPVPPMDVGARRASARGAVTA